MEKKIAILASGGNAPAMNNAVITIIKQAIVEGITPFLVYDGYKGLYEDKIKLADIHEIEQYAVRGNIFIGTARLIEFKNESTRIVAADNLKRRGIDTLVVIGGDGSYMGANLLSLLGINCFCIPGTIDNDVGSTDTTIGFNTCLNTIVNALDNIRDSFDSHSGVCLVEVMGRHCSDLAILSSISAGAEAVVTEQNIFTINDFLKVIDTANKNKKRSVMIVIAENIYGNNGLPSLKELALEIEKMAHRTVRTNIIGHIQRGGKPIASDRFLANTMGRYAVELIVKGKKNRAIGKNLDQIIDYDLNAATKMLKTQKSDLVEKFKQLSLI